MKLKLAAGLFVAASTAAFAQAPAGSAASQGTATQQRPATTSQASGSQQSTPAAKQGEQTLTGCLTSADNIYTLTVMDDSGAPGTTVSTTAYTLSPGTGVDLQGHLNKRVTVKGSDAGPDAQSSARVVMNTPPQPAPTGTSGTAAGNSSPANSGSANSNAGAGAGNASAKSGSATPTVQTTAKARINSKIFNVTDVQPASGNCGA